MHSFLQDAQITFVKFDCLRLTPRNKWIANWALPTSSRPAEGKAKNLEESFVGH